MVGQILDIATRSTVDTFTLSEGSRHVRIKTLGGDPNHKFVMMVIRPFVRWTAWSSSRPRSLQCDLASRKIVNTIPVANGEERENANMRFSPDGKLMYPVQRAGRHLRHRLTSKRSVGTFSRPQEEGFGAFDSARPMRPAERVPTAMFPGAGPGAEAPDDGHRPSAPRCEEGGLLHAGARRRSATMAPGRKVATGCSTTSATTRFWSSI